MASKRRIALAVTLGSALALIGSSIAGAVSVPTGFNIAAALIITVGILIEAPITAMALAKHHPHPKEHQ